MLSKLSVSNFKGFKDKFTLDLTKVNGYSFNEESIENGVVKHAMVYGHNGVGKTNLGLAIFDIIGHLTDKNVAQEMYSAYSNAFNGDKLTEFSYQFKFGQDIIEYTYHKKDFETLRKECFSINGEVLAQIDRDKNDLAEINFKGAETLKRELSNENLSVLRYIKNNASLDNNKENELFFTFFDYLERILFFRSLDKNVYLGLQTGQKGVQDDIIENNNVKDFEKFLNNAGVECKLVVFNGANKKELMFDFGEVVIPFYKIASTGTKSLSLLYYWLQRIRKESTVSFVFIDEFDAFYHHALSKIVIEELKKSGVQFIVTTHNTSLLSNSLLRPDCYFLMDKTQIGSLAKKTVKELREAHNIEKMYKAGAFYGK